MWSGISDEGSVKYHAREPAASLHQLLVRALLEDFAAVQHDHLVSVGQRVQLVGGEDPRLVLQSAADALLEQVLEAQRKRHLQRDAQTARTSRRTLTLTLTPTLTLTLTSRVPPV